MSKELDLWNGAQQLVSADVSVGTRFQAGDCEFVIHSKKVSEENLVVMVGVQQGPYVTSKLVKPG